MPTNSQQTAARQFREAVDQKIAAGLTRSVAVAAVRREQPTLTESMLKEANAGRRR